MSAGVSIYGILEVAAWPEPSLFSVDDRSIAFQYRVHELDREWRAREPWFNKDVAWRKAIAQARDEFSMRRA